MESVKFKKGWIAMNFFGDWYFFKRKPKRKTTYWCISDKTECSIDLGVPLVPFKIKKVKNWKKSLIKVG